MGRQAFILAGGRGSRLAAVTNGAIPKPLVEFNGTPLLERSVKLLKEAGFDHIFISVGYLAAAIQEHFGDGRRFGVNIEYIIEETPLGSGGALYYMKDRVESDLLIFPGDLLCDFDFNKLLTWHQNRKALVTLVTHPNIHPYDSDVVIQDEERVVTGFWHKNQPRPDYYHNNVNSGLMVINREALSYFTELRPCNIEHDFVASLVPTRRVLAYNSAEFVMDLGTPERLFGAASALALYQAHHRRAIFLDRDGTINQYRGFIKTAEEIELIPGVIEAIKLINEHGFPAIIISNQPVIARGEASFAEVNRMFDKIETLLGRAGAYLNGIYYCPHHPDKGFAGEIPQLKINCHCRKPQIGLLEEAAAAFDLDLSQSFLIGDSDIDIQTARNGGLKAIKIGAESATAAAARVPDLLTAVRTILEWTKL